MNRADSQWIDIHARLERLAIATPADPQFQPTDNEMRSVVEELYKSQDAIKAARDIHPLFDSLNLKDKYTILVSISPDKDVAEQKMRDAVHVVEEPYSEFPNG